MARKQEQFLSKKKGGAKDNNTTVGQISEVFYKWVSFIGFETLKVLKRLRGGERRLAKRIAAKIGPGLAQGYDRVLLFLRNAGRALLRPFVTAAHGFVLMRRNAAAARKEQRSAFAAVFRTFFKGIRRNTWFFKGILNYAAAAFGVAVVVAVVSVTADLNVAVAVDYDGERLGYIENENVYATASKMLLQRIVDEEGAPELDTPTFTLAVVDSSEMVDEDTLVNSMIQSASADIVESNGIYIDGEFYGAVADAALIEETVEAILAKYRTGAENETVELVKPVEIKTGLYLTKSVVDTEEIVSLLNSEVEGEVTYTVQEGDTPSGVAQKNGISYSEFKALNPDCETKFTVGQTVYLSKSEPFMTVQVTRRETYQQELMYETETVKDSSKSISYTAITQNGQKGINEITADVQYINGVEVGRTVVSTKVLQKVINQKLVKGTKQPQAASGSALNGNGTALKDLHFIWPLQGGEISSLYGSRWGTIHGGLDIRAPRGTPVYAAEDGTVELSRWYSGYGYCVIIDHGNGIKTLYGHASQLVAKAGQKVNKGDVIMLVGMTGQATGNHVHFEIRVNGNRIDPLPYIGK